MQYGTTTTGKPARCALLASAMLGTMATWLAAGSAQATEIDVGNPELKIRWDNTVRYNLARRMEGINPLIGNNATTDESDNKFPKGSTVNNRLDLLSEFDLVYQGNKGLRVSAAGWYDNAYSNDHITNGAKLAGRGSYTGDTYSNFTKRYYNGPSGELLDAFVFGNFDFGTTSVRLKAGKHSLFWGDVTFNSTHSVAYSQMPQDTRKQLSSPGIEAKETVLPVSQLSGQLQVSDDLAFAGFYFLDWKPNRLPEGGTYYGAADFLFQGPNRFSLAPGFAISNAPSIGPDSKHGNFGLNMRWSPAWLDGTLGVYYRKFDDRTPWSTPQINAVPGGFYRLAYARDTELYGIGLNKNLGRVAFAAELSQRRNTAFINSGINPVTLEGPLGNSTHLIANGTLLGNLSASVPYTAVAEIAYSRWNKVTRNANLFKGDGYAGCTGLNVDFACATKDYVGVSLLFIPKFLQLIPGGDLSIPMFYQVGVKGNAATLSGGNKGAGTRSIGVQLDYRALHKFSLTYSDFMTKFRNAGTAASPNLVGNGPLYNDRGLLTFTYSYSF
jgi:hypothetical protein